MEIKIPIKSHFAGNYRLEYDGKYVSLYGRDKRYLGFNFNKEDKEWFEEMVLIPVIIEKRKILPVIKAVTETNIIIELIDKI